MRCLASARRLTTRERLDGELRPLVWWRCGCGRSVKLGRYGQVPAHSTPESQPFLISTKVIELFKRLPRERQEATLSVLRVLLNTTDS